MSMKQATFKKHDKQLHCYKGQASICEFHVPTH